MTNFLSSITGSSVLGAAASIGSGLVGAKSQQSAQDKQNKFAYAMWQKQNEYNTPSNQRKRFEEAGLNPNLMMNGASVGNAESLGAQSAPDMASSYNNIGNGVNAALSSALEARSLDQQYKVQEAEADKAAAEAQNIRIDNMTKYSRDMANLLRTHNLTDIEKKELEFRQKALRFQVLKAEADANLSAAQADNVSADTIIKSYQAAIESVNLTWLPKEKELGLQNVLANTTQQLAAANASAAQAKAMLQQAALTYLESQGVKIDNRIKQDTEKFVVNGIKGINSSYASQSRIDKASADAYTNGWNSLLRGFGINTGDLIDVGKSVISRKGNGGINVTTNVNNKPNRRR